MKYFLLSFVLPLLLFPVLLRAGEDNCYLVVAGREATADGSVMLAHNEDNGMDYVFRFRRVERMIHAPGEFVRLQGGGQLEQADTTWAYTVWEMPGMHYSHGMVNEHAVAVVSNSCPSRQDRPDLLEGGIGPMLRWLVVERARTARQGAELVGKLVERYGYSASGRTLTIADPREAWQVAMVNGRHWVARRVPDNQVVVLANSYGIHRVDLEDTTNYMGSEDLIDYAVTRGWYAPLDGKKFDFEKAYARPDRLTDPNQRCRQWAGFRFFAGKDFAPPADGEFLPFAIEPENPVTCERLFEVLRDHYEETPFEGEGCLPHERNCKNRPATVCNGATNHGDVFRLNAKLPGQLRALWWYSFWRPCMSPFIPFYPSARSVPSALAFEVDEHVFSQPGGARMPGRGKAIGLFRELTLRLDESPWEEISEARSRWAEFEREQRGELSKLEDKLFGRNASEEKILEQELARFNGYSLEWAMKLAAQMLD